MIRVCSDWNLLYRCLSVDILLYDALLFQFLGISYGYYSTLRRMRSCCFQGSGPDSQHSAPCSTGSPDINSSTTIFAEFVYVALMLLLKAAHHASRQRAIPYLCLSLDFLKPFSREESCFLVTVNKLTSSFATLLLQNVFAYDDSKGLFCEALFLLKLLLLTLGRRVTVVVLSFTHSFIHSFILSSGTAFTSTPQLRHERDRHVKIFRFDSWILL